MVPPHPLLKKVEDDGKHLDTITHTPPANGDIIKGLSDKWDVLALGTGYLTFDPEGGTNGVNWRDLGTDPQDLVVYNAGAYSLKNDAASPPADSFYGAIVSGGTANIGWHARTDEDKDCGGGGGSGDTQCCPTGLSVRNVKVTESGPVKVELTLSFSKPLKKAGDNADVSLSGTATHSSETQNWNSIEATITGTSIDFTITLPGSWRDNVETEIKVTKISDGVLCTSNGKDFVVSRMLNTNTDCHKSIKVKLGDATGGDGDPTGRPCNATPMVTSIRVTITNGHTVGVEVRLSGMGFLKVDITSINGDDRAFVDGVIEHFPPNAARCTNGGVGAAGGPETNVARAIQKGKPNTVCLMLWTGCCSDAFNNTKWTKIERCLTVNVDENGNGETTINIPRPPEEPPPPPPTGNCDPKPTLACSKISFDNGTLMGFFEASRLVTGVARGSFRVSDANGNVLFQGEASTLIFSNQQASKNVIVVADRMVPLENNKTYNICITAGQLACWDNPQVLADPATCCAAITPVNGRGDGVPGADGGGGGDGGRGGNIPPGGGEKCIDNFDPGGGPTLAGGCTNVFLNGNRRFVVYNALGQHAIAVVIPTTYQVPKSFYDLPMFFRNILWSSPILAQSAADVVIDNGKVSIMMLHPKIGETSGAEGATYYNHTPQHWQWLWSTISPLMNLQQVGNPPPGIGINLIPNGGPQQIQGLNSGTGSSPIPMGIHGWPVDTRPKGANDKPTEALVNTWVFADILVGSLGLITHSDIMAGFVPTYFPLSSYLYPHTTYTRNKQIITWWTVLPNGMIEHTDVWAYIQTAGLGGLQVGI
jgi:hypothetical protein